MTARDPNQERAYRRGVHQAIHAIDSLIHEEEYLDVDPASVLDIAKSEARTLRYDNADHPMLIDELRKRIIKGLADAGLLD